MNSWPCKTGKMFWHFRFAEKLQRSGISAVKAEMYPSIALTGGYIAADVPHLVTITNAVTFGVGVQYNIGSLWKTKAKIVQAQAREKEITANEAATMMNQYAFM